MTIRQRWLIVILGGTIAADAGSRDPDDVVRKMTRSAIDQALRAGWSAPEPDASNPHAWTAAMTDGTLGLYHLGMSWFTTPYSRVVHVAVVAAQSQETPVVPKGFLAPELHVYLPPVDGILSPANLVVAFIRPAGSTGPGQNKYPIRVDPAEPGIQKFITENGGEWHIPGSPWSEGTPGIRLVFPLSALMQGSKLVAVYDDYLRNYKCTVCVQEPFDLRGVR